MLHTKPISAFQESVEEVPSSGARLAAHAAVRASAFHQNEMPMSKLVFDKLFAGAALLMLAPAMLGLAVMLRMGSSAPVLFGHTRIGHNGRRFRCLKFRTMRPNSDAELEELLRIDPIAREEWLRQRKLERDPRVDRLGHILRKTSLDELPQFWNVLCGDMSIVGPRPITEAEASKYGEHFATYTSVRPGLTGKWQVSGRSDASYEQRVALDVEYIRNWSMWQDISIAFRTVHVVLAGRGAC